MTFTNIMLALGYIDTLWKAMSKVSKMIRTAMAENRDITEEELKEVKSGAVSAREELGKALNK